MKGELESIKKFEQRGYEQGKLRTKRTDLLTAIRVRLQGPVPEPIRLAVEGTSDLEILDLWFDAALANTLPELRAAMKLEP